MTTINTTIVDETEDIYEVDHDTWVARKAAEHGFPVAGFVGEIYEDAVILIGSTFKFDWRKKNVKIGRVIHIFYTPPEYEAVSFVLLIEDGTQVSCTYGKTYDCFFALPEDSENFIKA